MTRNLKALGLVFVAALALSAVVASAASAQGSFKFEGAGPVTLTGSQGSPVDEFTTTAGSLKCTTTTYHGTMSTSGTTAVTATPKYSNCHIANIIPADIDMKSCKYNLTIDSASADTTGWIDVECSTPGDEITITVGHNDKTEGTLRCTIHVPPQTVSGIKYTNTNDAGLSTREIVIDVNATGLTYTETAGTGLGACANSTLQHGGTYTGTARVTGEEDTGTGHKGIFIS